MNMLNKVEQRRVEKLLKPLKISFSVEFVELIKMFRAKTSKESRPIK